MKLRICLFLIFLVLFFYSNTWGNDSAMNEGAYGPEPLGWQANKESVIKLVSENLDIQFGKKECSVAVCFTFRNTRTDKVAKQLLGFPDIGAAQKKVTRQKNVIYPEWIMAGPLKKMRTFINGKEVPSKLEYGFIDYGEDYPGWRAASSTNGVLMAWYTVGVEFPSNKEVIVKRSYKMTTGVTVGGIGHFNYITHTAGAWQGKIEKLKAQVKLNDGITVNDLNWSKLNSAHWDEGLTTWPPHSSWKINSPTHLTFEWNNFEPRTENNRQGFRLVTKEGVLSLPKE